MAKISLEGEKVPLMTKEGQHAQKIMERVVCLLERMLVEQTSEKEN